MDELQGTWTVVAVERDGRQVEDAVGIRVVFDGGRMITTARDRTGVARYVLDQDSRPRAIDFIYEYPEAPEPLLLRSIYRVESDMLTMCVPPPHLTPFPGGRLTGSKAHDRPGDFTAPIGTHVSLIVYKREAC